MSLSHAEYVGIASLHDEIRDVKSVLAYRSGISQRDSAERILKLLQDRVSARRLRVVLRAVGQAEFIDMVQRRYAKAYEQDVASGIFDAATLATFWKAHQKREQDLRRAWTRLATHGPLTIAPRSWTHTTRGAELIEDRTDIVGVVAAQRRGREALLPAARADADALDPRQACPVWVVHGSFLDHDLIGKGHGRRLYEALAAQLAEAQPILLVPHRAVEAGSTTDSAMKVWDKLGAIWPRRGLVVRIPLFATR